MKYIHLAFNFPDKHDTFVTKIKINWKRLFVISFSLPSWYITAKNENENVSWKMKMQTSLWLCLFLTMRTMYAKMINKMKTDTCLRFIFHFSIFIFIFKFTTCKWAALLMRCMWVVLWWRQMQVTKILIAGGKREGGSRQREPGLATRLLGELLVLHSTNQQLTAKHVLLCNSTRKLWIQTSATTRNSTNVSIRTPLSHYSFVR